MLASFEPGEGLLITTHGEMPWFESSPVATTEDDADLFVKTFPILANATKGSDPEYAKWFQKALAECEHGYLIYTMDDWSFCMSDGYLHGARQPFSFPPMGESEKQSQY